jgi:hypothetical protein
VAIGDAVRAAQAIFPSLQIQTPDGPHTLITVMVAIAGAETGWDPLQAGDAGLRGPSCDGTAHGRPVVAATSWGLWQIHNAHADFLRAQTGSDDACRWAQWLYTPDNNALAALHVLGPNPQSGLENWSTWGGRWTSWSAGQGPYLQYLTPASQAVGA